MNSGDQHTRIRNTVLIVEDEEILRDLLRMMLEDHGIKTLTAFDGVDAIEVFTAHREEIAVVISDLGLPRLGGWEAFLKMKELDPTVKGVLSSGYFHPDVKAEIIRTGANNFIQKPYNPPEIIAMIRELLERAG